MVLHRRRLCIWPGAGQRHERGSGSQWRQSPGFGFAPLNTSDFSSFLLQAQATNPNIIGLANSSQDTATRYARPSNSG